MNQNKTIERIAFGTICLSLFIFAFMFTKFNLHIMLIGFMTLCVLGITQNREVVLDFQFLIIALIFLLIAYIDYHAEVDTSLYYAIILPLSYVVGKTIPKSNSDISEKRINVCLIALTVGATIRALLNYYIVFFVDEFSTENWNEFWTRRETSRSLFEFDFIFATSLFVVAILLFLKKHYVISGTIFVVNIAFQYMISKTEGRLNLGILVITTFFILVVYLFTNHMSKKANRIVLIMIGAGALFLIIVAILVENNVLGLQDIYHNSYLYSSGGFIHNERFQLMRDGFVAMVNSPLGGWVVPGDNGGFVNCVWFIFAQEYDEVIFGLFILYIVISVCDATRLISRNMKIVDYWLLSVFCALNVYFIMETGPWRYREYFIFMLVVNGMIKGHGEIIQREKSQASSKSIREIVECLN